MKLLKRALLASFLLILLAPTAAFAATSPSLGVANPYSILSGTYTNTAPGTTLNGDLGYTTGPAVAATVNGHTHVADATYNQAGIDQGSALGNLNSQACSFSFAPGAIDLATDVTHGPVGVYTPGVYCITGAASIGGGGTITLDGAGTYIFRMNGALTTSANSIATGINGATACNVWWTPTAATTLGANSTFLGTDIDASGITIGSTVTWTGRALGFGGTVSTAVDTINTVPACATASTGSSTPGFGENTGTTSSTTPGLPNTGIAPQQRNMRVLAVPAAAVLATTALYAVRKKSLKGMLALLGLSRLG
ncbi:MAG TPA: ice-binding family protein [Candidatus Saccharimonadales bacterium]|nr:ice-binding family protein [Candidatus Saccharimonadales bacterium]